MTILTLTTGSAFIMWLGEQISERGIGNGMSLIIFVGIVVGLPRAIADLFELVKTQRLGPVHASWFSLLCWFSWSRSFRSSFLSKAASAAFRCSTPSALLDAA